METGNGEECKMSRRGFLRLSGTTLGTISLGSFLLTGHSDAAAIEFPELKCGAKDKADKRILVAYASKYGSTGGVADAIGKELCNRGSTVDVCLVKNVADLNPYRGIVVGSAIYRAQWLPEAVDFVERNRGVLRHLPVVYFLVCIAMAKPTEENRRNALAFLDPVVKSVPEVRPLEMGVFAGALNYSNLSWPMHVITKLKGAPEGDFRNWDVIRAWGARLHEVLGLG